MDNYEKDLLKKLKTVYEMNHIFSYSDFGYAPQTLKEDAQNQAEFMNDVNEVISGILDDILEDKDIKPIDNVLENLLQYSPESDEEESYDETLTLIQDLKETGYRYIRYTGFNTFDTHQEVIMDDFLGALEELMLKIRRGEEY